MAGDGDLEKRAVEELLRETSRARVRAETMGPAGWMKCPLRGTNKRFLVNTLRSSGLQRRSDGPSAAEQSAPGGRPRGEWWSRDRSRSSTPPGYHRDRHRDDHSSGGRQGLRGGRRPCAPQWRPPLDHRHLHGDSGDERHEQERDKSGGHKDKPHRGQRHRKDGHNTDPETHTLHSRESSPGERRRASRSHSHV